MAQEDGARLDPQARALIERVTAAGAPPLYALTAPEARRAYRESRAALAAAPVPVEEVRELSIPGPAAPLRARLYRARAGERALPGVVYFHGGGFIYGDLDTHDGVCRGIAHSASSVVVSVDYRLAPEHKFPAAVEDALGATAWVAANAAALGVDPERLVVGGDSAGGNLAAVTALAARERKSPRIAMQVLVYPVTDFTAESGSVARFAEGYLLTRESMRWVKRTYLREERDAADWRASPLLAEDFSGLPPAYVITAGFDPLVDEGKAYAERLAREGVKTAYREYPEMVHGFLLLGGVLDTANAAVEACSSALRAAYDGVN